MAFIDTVSLTRFSIQKKKKKKQPKKKKNPQKTGPECRTSTPGIIKSTIAKRKT
jgi:hypothetical protein